MTIKNRKDKAEPLPVGFDFHKVASNEDGFVLVQLNEDKDEFMWFKVTNPVVRIKDNTYLVLNTKTEAHPVGLVDKKEFTVLKNDGKYVLCAASYHPAGTARWYLLAAPKAS